MLLSPALFLSLHVAVVQPGTNSPPPRALGAAGGALLGGAAGAALCAGTMLSLEPSENAPFAMLAVCSLTAPMTLLGAAAGAQLASSDVADAVVGAGIGMIAGALVGAASGSIVREVAHPSDQTAALVVGSTIGSGAILAASIGAGIATLDE